MGDTQASARYPKDLQEWAGHHSGGVKRLFDEQSGRPAKELLRTGLILRLETWAKAVAEGSPEAPRVVLLVGGPGNGKTEAIEHALRTLDSELGAAGKLIERLSVEFHPPPGNPVPRVVTVSTDDITTHSGRRITLSIVQDASAVAGTKGRHAPKLLIEELGAQLRNSEIDYYLCCVNRGILDDAMIYAVDNQLGPERELLEEIARAISLTADAPSCWPLSGFKDIAVWPMDVESLLVPADESTPSPGATLLKYATAPESWPIPNSCPAGNKCPFCHSQKILACNTHRDALLKILRWYELASGKRWSFRDLLSIISYLLSGSSATLQGIDPCRWAHKLLEQDTKQLQGQSTTRDALTAIYRLVAAAYPHTLFHQWDLQAAGTLRKAIKDLSLDKVATETKTIIGLQYFLQDRRKPYLPSTISETLTNLAELLDPAIASPDLDVPLSSQCTIPLREIDTRFSRSIHGGLDSLGRQHELSPLELDLLNRLAVADKLLSSSTTRRKNPAAASRIQRILRDFACRLIRRNVCTQYAVVPDQETLCAFQSVVEDKNSGRQLHEVTKRVKELLNTGQNFEVSLTTTFGQPLPPPQRQATFVVPARAVRPKLNSKNARPHAPFCFLEVGSGASRHPVALTYDLFKAVTEIQHGLSLASLHPTVLALLDTTKSRMSGTIVRDKELLEEGCIRIGKDGIEISHSWDGFIATLGTSKQ